MVLSRTGNISSIFRITVFLLSVYFLFLSPSALWPQKIYTVPELLDVSLRNGNIQEIIVRNRQLYNWEQAYYAEFGLRSDRQDRVYFISEGYGVQGVPTLVDGLILDCSIRHGDSSVRWENVPLTFASNMIPGLTADFFLYSDYTGVKKTVQFNNFPDGMTRSDDTHGAADVGLKYHDYMVYAGLNSPLLSGYAGCIVNEILSNSDTIANQFSGTFGLSWNSTVSADVLYNFSLARFDYVQADVDIEKLIPTDFPFYLRNLVGFIEDLNRSVWDQNSLEYTDVYWNGNIGWVPFLGASAFISVRPFCWNGTDNAFHGAALEGYGALPVIMVFDPGYFFKHTKDGLAWNISARAGVSCLQDSRFLLYGHPDTWAEGFLGEIAMEFLLYSMIFDFRFSCSRNYYRDLMRMPEFVDEWVYQIIVSGSF